MARPREFDEDAALDAAMRCFWSRGYEATSVRDLAQRMGMTGASLYNAFGDKRALFQRALRRYVDGSLGERILRCERLPPREAVLAFFGELLDRSLGDPEHKGCMVVNATLDVTGADPVFQNAIVDTLRRNESFFLRMAEAGRRDGSITTAQPPEDLARHLLGLLMGLRVLARARPEPELLRGIVRSVEAALGPDRSGADRPSAA